MSARPVPSQLHPHDARAALIRIEIELRQIVRRSPVAFAPEADDKITAAIDSVGRLYVLIGLVQHQPQRR